MNTKLTSILLGAAFAAHGLLADGSGASVAETEPAAGASEAAEEAAPRGWNYVPGEGVAFGGQPVVSTELSLYWDSKYLSYGLVDNMDPIFTPRADVTFLDWFFVAVESVVDTTKYGAGAGYYSRAWKTTEILPEIGLRHSFSPDDWDFLPTTLELTLSWQYEYHPRSMLGPDDHDLQQAEELDSQFVMLEMALPDLEWVQPKLFVEQDVARDSGTYVNLELAHAFSLVDGASEDDDPVLSLTPSFAQGWGDRRRVRGYLSHRTPEVSADGEEGEPDWLSRAGLMDSTLKLELAWQICPGLSLSGYVAYVDFLFDRHVREAARRYEARGKYTESYNFVCGLALVATF